MRFRPCIDLHHGRVKQIVGGTYSDDDNGRIVTNFETVTPASTFAELYRRDGLVGGHVIMLGEGNEEAALSALKAFPGGLQIGGGITPANAERYLTAGASHVIVTSYVFSHGELHWERLREISCRVGPERLVLDISCRRDDVGYVVVTDRWQRISRVYLTEETFARLEPLCAEFLVHAAHVEGRQEGIDEQLVALLGAHAGIPVTYAGGVRSLDDLVAVARAGAGRVDATVGSALDLFGGPLPYADVVAWFRRQASG